MLCPVPGGEAFRRLGGEDFEVGTHRGQFQAGDVPNDLRWHGRDIIVLCWSQEVLRWLRR